MRPIEYVATDPSPLLAVAVRAIINYQTDQPAEPVVVPPEQWPRLWRQLVDHRVGSLVAPLVSAGTIEVPAQASRQLKPHSLQVAQLQLKLRAQKARTIQLLENNSIEVRVLKGLATSDLDYTDPVRRHTSDVDVLVRPEHFKRACGIINQPGVTALKVDEPTQLLVEATFRTAQGVEIDLHHRLFRFGPANEDLLFDQPDQLPGRAGLALGPNARLLHAAGHLLLAPPGHRRLSSLIDVAILGAADYVNNEAALELAGHFGLADIVRFALWLADSVGQQTSPEKPSPGAPATASSKLINRAHIRTRRSPALETAAVLADLGSASDRLSYLRYQARKHLARPKRQAADLSQPGCN